MHGDRLFTGQRLNRIEPGSFTGRHKAEDDTGDQRTAKRAKHRHEGKLHRHFGQHLIDQHLPPEGTPTQGVEAGYMANAWMRFKHENYDTLRKILDTVGETVKVRAR